MQTSSSCETTWPESLKSYVETWILNGTLQSRLQYPCIVIVIGSLSQTGKGQQSPSSENQEGLSLAVVSVCAFVCEVIRISECTID